MRLTIKCTEIRTRLVKTGPIGDMGFPLHGNFITDAYKESTDVHFSIPDGKYLINFYLPNRTKNEFVLGKSYSLEIKELGNATKSKK